MITLNEVGSVDLSMIDHLNEYSRKQWDDMGAEATDVLKLSESLWVLTDEQDGVHKFLMLIGVHRASLVGGTPVLWLLIGKEFTARYAKHIGFVLETIKERYSYDLTVVVNSGDLPQEKFATFFGFKLVSADETHKHYRVN